LAARFPSGSRSDLLATLRTNKWVTLAVVGIGVFMATLDASIVNISLPAIASHFDVPMTGTIEWVIIGYLVVVASLLLSVGRFSDLVGRRILLMWGIGVFTVGSALCGLAPSLYLLVAARGLQGSGAALLMAISPAILTGAFPREERGRALGLNALVVALGTSAGPTLGGVITEHLSWRWIFFVNLPLGVIGLLGTALLLQDKMPRRAVRFDPVGALCLALALSLLTLGLSFGEEWGWTSPGLMATLAVAVCAVMATVYVELHVPAPIVDLALLRNRVFASANFSLVLSFLALFAISFLMPFYFEQLRHYSAQDAGLLLTPLPLTIAVVAPFSGSLADRVGTRWLAACGLTIACAGLVVTAGLGASSSAWVTSLSLIIVGAGQALFQSPNNSALMGAAPAAQQGQAAGFLATGRVVGQSMSVAIAGAVMGGFGSTKAGQALAAGKHGTAALDRTFLAGFHGALLVCAGVAALGIVTSLARGQESRRRTTLPS
jgi:EmrB/QacA subfamily drug resistance transporter